MEITWGSILYLQRRRVTDTSPNQLVSVMQNCCLKLDDQHAYLVIKIRHQILRINLTAWYYYKNLKNTLLMNLLYFLQCGYKLTVMKCNPTSEWFGAGLLFPYSESKFFYYILYVKAFKIIQIQLTIEFQNKL